MKWPSRLSLGVKSSEKPDSMSYLPQVLFYFFVNVVVSKTRYFRNFLVLLHLFMESFLFQCVSCLKYSCAEYLLLL